MVEGWSRYTAGRNGEERLGRLGAVQGAFSACFRVILGILMLQCECESKRPQTADSYAPRYRGGQVSGRGASKTASWPRTLQSERYPVVSCFRLRRGRTGLYPTVERGNLQASHDSRACATSCPRRRRVLWHRRTQHTSCRSRDLARPAKGGGRGMARRSLPAAVLYSSKALKCISHSSPRWTRRPVTDNDTRRTGVTDHDMRWTESLSRE